MQGLNIFQTSLFRNTDDRVESFIWQMWYFKSLHNIEGYLHGNYSRQKKTQNNKCKNIPPCVEKNGKSQVKYGYLQIVLGWS